MMPCCGCRAECAAMLFVELEGSVAPPEGPLCTRCGREFAGHVAAEHTERIVFVHVYGYEGSATAAQDAWAARSSDLERRDNPPSWVADEVIWDQAKRRVRPHWSEYRQPYAVVTRVYEQLGGKFR